MRYFSKTPGQPLGDYVERLWHFSDAPAHSRERIVPSGTVELVINLQEDEVRIYDPARPDGCKRFSGAVVSGVYSGCFVIDTREHASIIGVHFRAGGAFHFFDMPVSELRDTHVDLETLWGAAAAELRERLCATATPAERLCLLEQALTNRLSSSLEHHSAVRFALNAFARADSDLIVSEIAKETGFSQRRFIQVFKQEVGMSPKLYCRVRRFQQALVLARRQATTNWAQLALACGYFDQSHFINEFRSFSGLSPLEYARQRSERVLQNHVPVIV